MFWQIAAIATGTMAAAAVHGNSISAKIMSDADKEPPYRVEGELVSVVIPTYHEEDYIRTTLDAIKHQTYEPIEIVISDASQGQESIDNMTIISSEYDCVFVHTYEKNVSLGRNMGADAASGEILVFLDADCVMAQNFVEKLVGDLSDTIRLSHGLDVFHSAPSIHQGIRVLISNNKPYYYTSGRGICIRKSDFNEIGGYDTDIDPTKPYQREDLDLGSRVIDMWGTDSIYLDKDAYVAEAYRRPFTAIGLNHTAWVHRGYRNNVPIDKCYT